MNEKIKGGGVVVHCVDRNNQGTKLHNIQKHFQSQLGNEFEVVEKEPFKRRF
jgi:hypothetical protein